MSTADELKALGNKAIAAKNFDEAVDKFTQAIALTPDNHILYSNRSAAYASKRDYENALKDAEKTTELKPDWPKGWSRKGAALHGRRDLAGALDAYKKSSELDPNNAAVKNDIANIERALQTPEDPMGDPSAGLGQMFSDPNLIAKLAANPKTSSFISDPVFMNKIQQIQRDPKSLNPQELTGDPRFLQVLGVLMGVDMQMGMPDEAGPAGGAPPREAEEEIKRPEPAKKAPEPEPEPEPMEEDEESIAKRKAKEEADKLKAQGTAEYKKRNFDAAIENYSKAWETHKDITYLTNLSAAYFEKGDYEKCIEACTQAVNEGREIYADFKLIAKAYARIGSAYEKQADLTKAIEYYNMSLREHRTPDILNKLRAAEKKKLEDAKKALIDPEKAEEARVQGNEFFKKSEYTEAYKAYEDMAKRSPEDPRGYSNKAAALIKLGELPSALDECNTAIKKDKTFIRAYIRKAQALFMMKRYSDCLDACEQAAEVDLQHHNGASAREIEQQQQKALAKMYESREGETEEQTRERIMRDPDIMAVMQDPVMQSILQQAQSDPAALREHMKNAGVRSKIQKLIAAGVIRVG
ncbi:heat shock protein sti1 [Diaporthe amygdali]|uniref:heat shock protein sti1 n=1 Tax=Phomopsis amygdali TaxID=1214568 RepID=UPI0022FE4A63|nr:heat shock protein sti1 [Diaporthe amygdali]KAJ0122662.1 heat shock protein sti1 [Diaporthe amygdali]